MMDIVTPPPLPAKFIRESLLAAEASDADSAAVAETNERTALVKKVQPHPPAAKGTELAAAGAWRNTAGNTAPRTTSTPRKKGGQRVYLVGLLVGIGLAYICYFIIELVPAIWPLKLWGLLVFTSFHIFFILFAVAFYKSATIDPGRVPSQWGFKQGDRNKQRRYCKICNVWKPDRCHHCSSCNRCVLNMDHHCPWLNNCVGFQNRRFFVQLLIYGLVCCLFVAAHGITFMICVGIEEWNSLPSSSPSPPPPSLQQDNNQHLYQGGEENYHQVPDRIGDEPHNNSLEQQEDNGDEQLGKRREEERDPSETSGEGDDDSPSVTNRHEDAKGEAEGECKYNDPECQGGRGGSGGGEVDNDGAMEGGLRRVGDEVKETKETESEGERLYKLHHKGKDIHSPPNLGDMLSGAQEAADLIIVAVLAIVALLLAFALVPFLRFHLQLVAMNSTTIESLDKDAAPRRYDMGTPIMNCKQVFGSRPGCWGCPVHAKGAHPVGDGVNWALQYRTLANNNDAPAGVWLSV